ncbi:flagellin [Psychromonas sp. SR45-3]|uniref:flagellin N-terminal helical domain-containing protein n=1 Tax=Psychromonas sp. SR45-3 TaxID=2760930 RepID=UPI0015F9FF32|nr:flagellin [Psychromonas sp. SR45-3]MBB1271644.1 flagellin [Psychromonas sp. SR45-3]
MAQVINTNIMSLNAQRQLNKSQLTQNEAMERLSSGLRINSAKDDAAGLAISTGMQSQIRGINQAVRNANDGISMSQTAEGSMDEMTNILQRMRELSVQAANDTNSADNKLSIQKEVDQLYTELDRISQTTQFNGTNLLDGSNPSTTLQIGANSGENLTFSIAAVTTAALGLDGGVNKGDLNGGRVVLGAVSKDLVAINGVDIGAITATGGAAEMERVINLETASTGVVADAYNVVEGASASDTTGITNGLQFTVGTGDTVTLGATSSIANLAETINRDVEGITATVGDAGNIILNNDSGESIKIAGATASLTGAGLEATTFEGYLGLTSQSGEPIEVGQGSLSTAAAGVPTNTEKFGFLISNGDAVLSKGITPGPILETDKLTINGVDLVASAAGTIADQITAINKLTDETGVTATPGTAPANTIIFTSEDGGDIVIASGKDTTTDRTAALTKLGVNEVGGTAVTDLSLSVTTSDKAVRSLDKIDSALQQISESRASLGAIQNRLGSTISNLENVSQNLSASNSRIQDADFAAETSKMSKAQILQQAGTAMLSQANASTQNVLSLLQG